MYQWEIISKQKQHTVKNTIISRSFNIKDVNKHWINAEKQLQFWRNIIKGWKLPLACLHFRNGKGRTRFALPHKAAHSISELNLFLYLRISGVSLCGRVFVGFTLTTDPFRVGSCLIASDLIASLENPTEKKKKIKCMNYPSSARFWTYIFTSYNPSQ